MVVGQGQVENGIDVGDQCYGIGIGRTSAVVIPVVLVIVIGRVRRERV